MLSFNVNVKHETAASDNPAGIGNAGPNEIRRPVVRAAPANLTNFLQFPPQPAA